MLENWKELNNHLEKTFEFKSFLKTISFVNAVAWVANQQNHHPQIVIDFNKVRFLDTDDIVLLACLIDLYNEKDCTIEFINGNKYLNNYLRGIKFKKYWNEGFNRDNFTDTYNKQTLCLWHISESMIHQYSHYAKQYYESNFIKSD